MSFIEITQPVFDAMGQEMQNAILLSVAITFLGMAITTGVRSLINKVGQFLY